MAISVPLLQDFQEGLRLIGVLECDLDVHAGALYWQDLLQVFDYGQALGLDSFVEDDSAVDLVHAAEDHRGGKLILGLPIYALRADPIRYLLLQVLQFVAALHLAHLKLALVKDLANDLVTRHFAELFQVVLSSQDATLHISVDLIHLKHLVDVVFLPVAPVCHLVRIAS